jgi:hypothetical protein
MGGNEAFAATNDPEFVSIQKNAPGQTFLFKNADKPMCRREAAMQSLRREIKGGFSGNGQHTRDGLLFPINI